MDNHHDDPTADDVHEGGWAGMATCNSTVASGPASMTRIHDASLERDFAEKLLRRRRTLLNADGSVWGSPHSQTAVARRLGIAGPTLCRWENCVAFPPSFAVWRLWARAVGMNFHLELE